MIFPVLISASAVWIMLPCCLADDVAFHFELNRNPMLRGGSNTTDNKEHSQTLSGETSSSSTRPPPTKKMQKLFDLGDFEAHPQPLPRRKKIDREMMIMSPYKKIYHGKRVIGDKRVYNARFDLEASFYGQHLLYKDFFNCTLTQVIAEAEAGIPIVLQGGGNYKYFMVVFKADAGVPLKGRLRAYCKFRGPEV